MLSVVYLHKETDGVYLGDIYKLLTWEVPQMTSNRVEIILSKTLQSAAATSFPHTTHIWKSHSGLCLRIAAMMMMMMNAERRKPNFSESKPEASIHIASHEELYFNVLVE